MTPVIDINDMADCSIRHAAAYLGLSVHTLRHWDNTGKLKAHRDPDTKERCYTHNELIKVKNQMIAENYNPHSRSKKRKEAVL